MKSNVSNFDSVETLLLLLSLMPWCFFLHYINPVITTDMKGEISNLTLGSPGVSTHTTKGIP